uniref:Uncharacterized protein n=1 Tax=Pseudonaja textilis TaxID=8673 RepID=A0A670YDD2_PSETE
MNQVDTSINTFKVERGVLKSNSSGITWGHKSITESVAGNYKSQTLESEMVFFCTKVQSYLAKATSERFSIDLTPHLYISEVLNHRNITCQHFIVTGPCD